MRHTRAATWIGVAVGTTVLLTGGVAAVRWTLIPLRVNARVVDVGYEDGTTGHLRTLALDDGRTLVVDRGLVVSAGESTTLRGAALRKDRWQRTVAVDGRSIPLSIPADIWFTLAALGVPIVVGWCLRATARPSAGDLEHHSDP